MLEVDLQEYNEVRYAFYETKNRKESTVYFL